MDFSFRHCDAMKNGDGFFFDPIRKAAAKDQVRDFRKVSTV
jgi:hypothetical protein